MIVSKHDVHHGQTWKKFNNYFYTRIQHAKAILHWPTTWLVARSCPWSEIAFMECIDVQVRLPRFIGSLKNQLIGELASLRWMTNNLAARWWVWRPPLIFYTHAVLLANCSNLWAITCWFPLVYTLSKDTTAEDNITFCDTFGLKPSSSFMVSLARGWSSALLNAEHKPFSQSSRKDAFCSKWNVN